MITRSDEFFTQPEGDWLEFERLVNDTICEPSEDSRLWNAAPPVLVETASGEPPF